MFFIYLFFVASPPRICRSDRFLLSTPRTSTYKFLSILLNRSVTSLCTVLLLIPNRLAASRTVVRFSMIKTASSQARSSIFPFKLRHAPYPVMLHVYVKE